MQNSRSTPRITLFQKQLNEYEALVQQQKTTIQIQNSPMYKIKTKDQSLMSKHLNQNFELRIVR